MSLLFEDTPCSSGDAILSFLLHPGDEHDNIENKLSRFANDEIRAVDQYLNIQAGSRWAEAKGLHRISTLVGSWRALWPGRVACRLMLAEKERGNSEWTKILQNNLGGLRLHPFEVPHIGTLQIVVSGGFLDAELSRSYHPSITGYRLGCESPGPERISELTDRYRLALGLLERHDPEGFALFAGSVSAIAPLQTAPPLEAGRCVSLSIAAAPGIVLLTMIPIILLSETLLHEAAHCRLSAAEDLVPLWSSSGPRVRSPLRPDPRPIAGLYHQTYVLFWLSRFFRRLREAKSETVVQRNLRQIEKRIVEISAGFQDAVATLRANRNELSPVGERLLEEMALGNVA